MQVLHQKLRLNEFVEHEKIRCKSMIKDRNDGII